MFVEIKEGKDLSDEEVQLINKFRKSELGSESIISVAPNNENWTKKFFLVREDNIIVAFGRLHEVDVEFIDKKYSVFGIAGIVALKKGMGYGRELIKAMISYAQKDGKDILGFCEPKVSGFYEKCGLSIIKGNDRFLYKDLDGKLHKKDEGGDSMYLRGSDNLITEILENPSEPIIILRPHW